MCTYDKTDSLDWVNIKKIWLIRLPEMIFCYLSCDQSKNFAPCSQSRSQACIVLKSCTDVISALWSVSSWLLYVLLECIDRCKWTNEWSKLHKFHIYLYDSAILSEQIIFLLSYFHEEQELVNFLKKGWTEVDIFSWKTIS